MKKESTDTKAVWEETFEVDWEMVSLDNHMMLTDLIKAMLKSAVDHAEHLGFGFTNTSKEDLSWVLLRLNIQIERLPAWKEQIKVSTWPSRVKTLTAFREFEIKDAHDDVICRATSEWSVINLKTRRPQPISSLKDLYQPPEAREYLTRSFPKPDPKHTFEKLFQQKVRYTDMDMNGHVNAGKYFDWFSDALYEVSKTNNVGFISFHYQRECRLGETLTIEKGVENPLEFRGLKPDGKLAFWACAERKES
jgi:acyl-ACP thioesterase